MKKIALTTRTQRPAMERVFMISEGKLVTRWVIVPAQTR
jgi:hypothetical protein